jgi:hypothetical protein
LWFFADRNGNRRETAMKIRLEKGGPVIGSPSTIMDDFRAATEACQAEWEQRLRENPGVFRRVERDIKRHFNQGADHFTAAVLARVTQGPEMEHHVRQVREEAAVGLRSPQRRSRRVRLLSGLVLFVTTLYCPRRPAGRKREDATEQAAGLFPELAALGISNGSSPALQALVARMVALSPSIHVARKELRRQGLKLDKKTVRRLAEQLGTQFLVWRQRELLAWREQAALTPAGDELAGCRVAVQIDGGRVRMREDKKRQAARQKGQRKKFKTPWREPKAVIIFVFDQQGKMIRRDRQPLIDGTLLGPDHLAELVAWHLHRLGAAKAEMVVFVSDGARWIWDRLDEIIRRAGLNPSRTARVLDWCHAVQHLHRALELLKLNAQTRRAKFAELRGWLKHSRHAEVVAELERLAAGRPEKHKVWTEIRYLRTHGEAGHLQYRKFRRRGLPCGSGAIESTIRRVINLRLKSNAMYWLAENAEAMFALRANLLSDRWEPMLDAVQQTMSRDRRLTWHWQAACFSPNATPDVALHLPQPVNPEPVTHIST